MKRFSAHIEASAMGYAISFLLLTGLITSAVLFVASANKLLERSHQLDEHMLFDNYLGLRFGAMLPEAGTRTVVHPAGDTTRITVRNWGAFRAITAYTFHGTRIVEKSALVGRTTEESWPVLYLPNRKQVIKLNGKTLLEGEVFSSARGFERGHITGFPFEGDKLLHGELRESERQLPGIKQYIQELDFEHLSKGAVKLEALQGDSLFRFTEPTTLLTSMEALQISNRLEGNLIIHSFDSIYVTASSVLNHVILLAPVIRFEKGFHGSVQAIATRQIHCEEGVQLRYPSALILHETEAGTLSRNGIFMEEGSRLLGGALLISDKTDFRHPVYLGIQKAVIGGLVYNQGETEVQGKIIGSLYTNELALKMGGGEYRGHLCNATLSTRQLPNRFVYPDWLSDVRLSQPELLTCF